MSAIANLGGPGKDTVARRPRTRKLNQKINGEMISYKRQAKDDVITQDGEETMGLLRPRGELKRILKISLT